MLILSRSNVYGAAQAPINMTLKWKAACAVALALCMTRCGRDHARSGDAKDAIVEFRSLEQPARDTVGGPFKHKPAETPLSSSAAQEDPNDKAHRFIRTVDVRCRVNDVVSATYAIEAIVRDHGGYVEHTSLRSAEERKEQLRASRDSVLERSWITVHNDLRIRVPNTRLDSTLIAIAPLVDFLDRRDINASDVHLQLLANELEQSRLKKHGQRVESAIDRQGRRLKETTPAEDKLLNRSAESDQAMLDNLAMEDHVAFSAVSFDLYQRETPHAVMLAVQPEIPTWSEPFGGRALASLATGWSVFTGLVLLLLKVWPLWVLAAIGWIVVRKVRPAGVRPASTRSM